MKKLLTILLLTACALQQTLAQELKTELMSDTRALPGRDSRIHATADILSFFKNNEYFSDRHKGATYPGISLSPAIGYRIDSTLIIQFGIHGTYYSGDQKDKGPFRFRAPFVRVQYNANPDFSVIFGNYYGGVNHRLVEPLYDWERHMIAPPESGLQLLYKTPKLFLDMWIDWQQYIEKDDPYPERLTFGTSADIRLFSNSNMSLTLPIQMLINHSGGQIDTSEEAMIVAGNIAAGLRYDYNLSSGFLKKIGLDIFALGYYDKLPNRELRPYTRGGGVYPVLRFDASPLSASIGYWNSHKFYAFGGNPLFSSFNPDYPDALQPKGGMVTAKFAYSKKIKHQLAIGGQIETYTDLSNSGKTDYSFGIHLRFNFSGI